MAFDTFLKLDGIKGESVDSKHKDELEILSFSFGAENAGSRNVGGGGGAGKVSFHDLHFVHRLDKASPRLLLACASGQHIKEATITVRKAGSKDPLEYVIIKFYDLLVSTVQLSGSSESPTESVSMNYSKMEMEYKQQKADGTLDAGVFFKYDLKQNKQY